MILYGAGGHAKVIMDILNAQGVEVKGLVDDNPSLEEFMGMEVLHAMPQVPDSVIVSIGLNGVRKKVADRLSCHFGMAVHPTAILSPSVVLGQGSVVMPGAIINSSVVVGRHAIVNTGASIDHDCVVGDFSHVSPHATLCGGVHVGEGTWIGAGAVVIPGIQIGSWCVIGAGSVVTRNIPDGVKAYGNPCKIHP